MRSNPSICVSKNTVSAMDRLVLRFAVGESKPGIMPAVAGEDEQRNGGYKGEEPSPVFHCVNQQGNSARR